LVATVTADAEADGVGRVMMPLEGRGVTNHEETRRVDSGEREERIIAERLFLQHYPHGRDYATLEHDEQNPLDDRQRAAHFALILEREVGDGRKPAAAFRPE
jgi:hypothetical protein